jgi:hypothetical protein
MSSVAGPEVSPNIPQASHNVAPTWNMADYFKVGGKVHLSEDPARQGEVANTIDPENGITAYVQLTQTGKPEEAKNLLYYAGAKFSHE